MTDQNAQAAEADDSQKLPALDFAEVRARCVQPDQAEIDRIAACIAAKPDNPNVFRNILSWSEQTDEAMREHAKNEGYDEVPAIYVENRQYNRDRVAAWRGLAFDAIVQARADVPSLLDLIEAQRMEIERLTAERDDAREGEQEEIANAAVAWSQAEKDAAALHVVSHDRDEWKARATAVEAALKTVQQTLEEIQMIASGAIGPNCGAGPELVRIAGHADATLVTIRRMASGRPAADCDASVRAEALWNAPMEEVVGEIRQVINCTGEGATARMPLPMRQMLQRAGMMAALVRLIQPGRPMSREVVDNIVPPANRFLRDLAVMGLRHAGVTDAEMEQLAEEGRADMLADPPYR